MSKIITKIKKDKFRAMMLKEEADDINETGLNPSGRDIHKMYHDAADICPHDDLARDKGLDTDDVEVWVCPDCGVSDFRSKLKTVAEWDAI